MYKCGLSLLLIPAAFACIFAALPDFSVRARPDAPATLALALWADRDVYKMTDPLRLETRLTNVGSKAVYVWEEDLCWNPARGLTMQIVDVHGNVTQGRVLWDCLPPVPCRGDVYRFLKLAPQRFYGRAEEFAISDIVNGPGEYDVQATFSSFLSSKWVTQYLTNDPIGRLPLWTMEQPMLKSNSFHITVKR